MSQNLLTSRGTIKKGKGRQVTSTPVSRDELSEELRDLELAASLVSLTVLFTDLRESTRLYREVGDARALGLVMNHFSALKEEIAVEHGTIVKTIGDAVMAVFQQPASALRSILAAQRKLADSAEGTPSLIIKAGIHEGPCIAVKLDNHLDYFGSTVNIAARLETVSNGRNVVISSAVRWDPEVSQLLCGSHHNISTKTDSVVLKGFDQKEVIVYLVSMHSQSGDS